jgi:23S rRNA (uracil1939-C5)-methyltransferase
MFGSPRAERNRNLVFEMSMNKNFEVEIEKLLWRGRGLARLESGMVVMVDPGVLPGERVLVETVKETKGYVKAVPVRVVTPSPLRRNHPCPLADRCGGCRFGIMPAAHGLAVKREVLLEAMQRGLRGHAPKDLARMITVVPSPKNWRYRFRAQVHVRGGKPHFRELAGSGLVPVHDCLLLAEPLAKNLDRLCFGAADGRLVVAAGPGDGIARNEHDPGLIILPFPRYDLDIHLPAGGFFQANWGLNQTLVDMVTEMVGPGARVADLYSGAGNFALPLARRGADVFAVEGFAPAARAGRDNAARLGLRNAVFRAGDLAKDKSWNMIRDFAPRVAVLDPPRTGAPRVGARLDRLRGLDRLVWVSCDVVNTCRDLRIFLESGWEIRDLVMADMFPHTWHCEVVLVLDRA